MGAGKVVMPYLVRVTELRCLYSVTLNMSQQGEGFTVLIVSSKGRAHFEFEGLYDS